MPQVGRLHTSFTARSQEPSFLACSFGQELRGLGIANLAGAMFNTYTTTGSFSRSAVMDQCGAKTQLAAYIQVGMFLACQIEPPALLRVWVLLLITSGCDVIMLVRDYNRHRDFSEGDE